MGPSVAAGGRRKPVTLVFFIGGVTYAEISALRLLSENTGRDFIVATTQLMNGRSTVSDLLQEFDGELIMEAAGRSGLRRR